MWHPCPVCGVQYGSAALARGCEQAHATYDAPVPMFHHVGDRPVVERRIEVFAVNGQYLCGQCATHLKTEFLTVWIAEPVPCDQCGVLVTEDEIPEVSNPSFLPESERHDIARLSMTRRARIEQFRRWLHEELADVSAHSSGSERLDDRLGREFGRYRDDPTRGDVRLPTCGAILPDPESEEVPL